MRTSCVGVEPSRDGPCAREPRGRAAPAPRPPPSAAAWHLERPLILEGDRQDRVALVEDHRVRPADQDAQGPVVVGDAYVALAEGDAALRRFLEDLPPDSLGALVAVHPRALRNGLLHDVRHLVIGVNGDGARVERVDEAERNQEPEEDLHGFGRYTQIFAAAGSPSVIVCPSLAAVIVPAHGATSVIFRRRPGRTSFFQRCSSSFLKNRSEEHTSELQSPCNLVCRLLLEKKKNSCSR